MKENSLDRPTSSISEVLAIHASRGILLTKKEQIRTFVEQPLVKACEIFWNKNIKTYESSANQKDIQSGFCHITIDFNSLSPENREIAIRYGKPISDIGVDVIDIKIPISKDSTVDQISEKAVATANGFKKQTASWVPRLTLENQIKYYTELKNRNQNNAKEYDMEIERIKKPGEWENDCKRLGKYFDTKTQTAYESEEHFKKANEIIINPVEQKKIDIRKIK